MAGEDVEPYEYSLLNKKGKKIEAIITTKLINYENTKAILGIITDISDLKSVQKEREQLKTQLIQAQKMEAIGTLAGGIAISASFTAASSEIPIQCIIRPAVRKSLWCSRLPGYSVP